MVCIVSAGSSRRPASTVVLDPISLRAPMQYVSVSRVIVPDLSFGFCHLFISNAVLEAVPKRVRVVEEQGAAHRVRRTSRPSHGFAREPHQRVALEKYSGNYLWYFLFDSTLASDSLEVGSNIIRGAGYMKRSVSPFNA